MKVVFHHHSMILAPLQGRLMIDDYILLAIYIFSMKRAFYAAIITKWH